MNAFQLNTKMLAIQVPAFGVYGDASAFNILAELKKLWQGQQAESIAQITHQSPHGFFIPLNNGGMQAGKAE